jgi:hypothetical protein
MRCLGRRDDKAAAQQPTPVDPPRAQQAGMPEREREKKKQQRANARAHTFIAAER